MTRIEIRARWADTTRKHQLFFLIFRNTAVHLLEGLRRPSQSALVNKRSLVIDPFVVLQSQRPLVVAPDRQPVVVLVLGCGVPISSTCAAGRRALDSPLIGVLPYRVHIQ